MCHITWDGATAPRRAGRRARLQLHIENGLPHDANSGYHGGTSVPFLRLPSADGFLLSQKCLMMPGRGKGGKTK